LKHLEKLVVAVMREHRKEYNNGLARMEQDICYLLHLTAFSHASGIPVEFVATLSDGDIQLIAEQTANRKARGS